MLCRAIVRRTSVDGIEETKVFKQVPQHDTQVPDIGRIGPASGKNDFRGGEGVRLYRIVVMLIAPSSETDVSDFGRSNYGICGCVSKIATRLIYDAAVRVGHFTRGRVLGLISGNTVKDCGIAEAHHDVVRF